MIDFKELKSDGELWELFARDFLSELGFIIESPPDRGADGGKDFIICETISGIVSHIQFRWLVSCKNFAIRNKAVNENDDEKNILERCRSFKADGFLGFYSTIASTGLNTRLMQLKQSKDINDYKIFDYKSIESNILEYGFSKLLLRYFPESYRKIKPIHKIFDQLVELKCDCCGKDLLEDLYNGDYHGLVSLASKENEGITEYHECYFACKGDCDRKLEAKVRNKGLMSSWEDISDLVKPNFYLRYILATINQLNSREYIYLPEALKKERLLIMALSQKVFHEVTEEERNRFNEILSTGIL